MIFRPMGLQALLNFYQTLKTYSSKSLINIGSPRIEAQKELEDPESETRSPLRSGLRNLKTATAASLREHHKLNATLVGTLRSRTPMRVSVNEQKNAPSEEIEKYVDMALVKATVNRKISEFQNEQQSKWMEEQKKREEQIQSQQHEK